MKQRLIWMLLALSITASLLLAGCTASAVPSSAPTAPSEPEPASSSSSAPSSQNAEPASSMPPESSQPSSVPSAPQPKAETDLVANPLVLQLLGDGQGSTGVALFADATATGAHLELNHTDALHFLSNIGLESFAAAEMKAEIPIPDAMIGSAEGEYISIGMPHTATLYLYRDGEQAVVVGEQTTYYDIPTTTYQTILTLLS